MIFNKWIRLGKRKQLCPVLAYLRSSGFLFKCFGARPPGCHQERQINPETTKANKTVKNVYSLLIPLQEGSSWRKTHRVVLKMLWGQMRREGDIAQCVWPQPREEPLKCPPPCETRSACTRRKLVSVWSGLPWSSQLQPLDSNNVLTGLASLWSGYSYPPLIVPHTNKSSIRVSLLLSG